MRSGAPLLLPNPTLAPSQNPTSPPMSAALTQVNSSQTLYRDYQRITLQEPPTAVPPGRLPRQKDVILQHDLIDTCKPGDEVTVNGTYVPSYDLATNVRQGFPVFSTFVEANNVVRPEDSAGDRLLTEADVKAIKDLSRQPRIGEAARRLGCGAPAWVLLMVLMWRWHHCC